MSARQWILGAFVAGSMIAAVHAQSTGDQQKSQASAQATEQKAPTQDKTGTQDKARVQDRIYGSQLMTDAERSEYRAKMRSLKTKEERDALRAEHHKLMQERAKERGVTLPDIPPRQGMHQGRGRPTGPGSK